jgi:hypothetical protein
MDDPALAFFKADAAIQGLTLEQYGDRYGIVFPGGAKGQEIATREVQLQPGHIEQAHCSSCTGHGSPD